MPQREKKEVPLKAQLQEHRNLFIALACVLVVAIAGGIWYAHEQKALPAQGSTVSSQLVKTADSELSLNGVYLDQSWDEAKDGLGRELSTSDSKDGAVHHKFTDMDVVVKDDKVIMLTSSSPAAQSKRGIHQGSSLDDVVNAYGDDYQASEYGAQIHYEYTFKTDDGKQESCALPSARTARPSNISASAWPMKRQMARSRLSWLTIRPFPITTCKMPSRC